MSRESLDRIASIIDPVATSGGGVRSPSRGPSGGALGGWVGSLVSATLALLLPGEETNGLIQTLRFHGPIEIGDSIAAAITVTDKSPDGWRVVLDCIATNQRGRTVVSGSIEAIVPPG